VLECGRINLRAMELLDTAHTSRFGNPVPVAVETGTRKGPGILVTGHDLLDLYELLRQSQGTGVTVYTHGEMLPAHGYPELKKFAHLAGNYGGAWQEQKKEFNAFSGPILATTNCIQIPPQDTYLGRFFVTGITGLSGAVKVDRSDFSSVIKKALSLAPLPEAPGGRVMTGFHHAAVAGLVGKIIGLVQSGRIKHFFLIGGCDGAKPGRNYYTEFAKKVPKDCVIITLACGKYRFNKIDFGDIEGIPRLIDVGQCNNAYSAIQIALALARAAGCGVNELPLSFILSWFEQKAVAILLTLFSLGIKGIHIGPSAPAFLSAAIFALLREKFEVRLVSTPEEDLGRILKK